MTTTRTETVTTEGGSFSGHVALPDGSGPGLLVLQEIFGVNTYIRSVLDRVAQMGYMAMAPDMFWRQERDFVVEPDEGDDGMTRAFAAMGSFDETLGSADLEAALDHLRRLPECDGRVGVIGFCFGGTLTFLAASDHDPECAVSYYGSGVADALEAKAAGVSCPILFHFGGDDPYLPNEMAEAIAAQDEAPLTQAPGVGTKLATRIVAELKDKVPSLAALLSAGSAVERAGAALLGATAQDAVSALVNLGYRRAQAFGAVAAAAREHGPNIALEDLIRTGLKELAAGPKELSAAPKERVE